MRFEGQNERRPRLKGPSRRSDLYLDLFLEQHLTLLGGPLVKLQIRSICPHLGASKTTNSPRLRQAELLFVPTNSPRVILHTKPNDLPARKVPTL
jgi:hypothetical protein